MKTAVAVALMVVFLIVGGVAGYVFSSSGQIAATSTVTSTVTQTGTVSSSSTSSKPVTPGGQVIIADVSGIKDLNPAAEVELVTRHLQQEGWNVQHQIISTAAASAAMSSGSAQLMLANFGTVAPLISKSPPGSYYAVFHVVEGKFPLWFMVLDKGVTLQSFTGNSSIKMGTSTLSDSGYVFAANLIKQAGGDPSKVNWAQVGGTGARLAALLAGQIQGGLVYTSTALQLVSSNPKFYAVNPNSTLINLLWAKSSWASDPANRPFLLAFGNAWIWLANYMEQHPQQYVEEAVTYIAGNYNSTTAAKWAPAASFFLASALVPYPEDQIYTQLQMEVSLSVAQKQISAPIDPHLLYNGTIYDQAVKSFLGS